MIGADHAVARVDRGAFDDRQNIALHAFARYVGAVAGFASRDLVNLVYENNAHLLGALDGQARHLIHVQQFVFFFLDEVIERFGHGHLAAPLLLAENSREHVLDVDVHFLNALAGNDFKRRRGTLADLNFHQTLVELAVAQLRAQFFPGAVHLVVARRFDLGRGRVGRAWRLWRRRSGKQQIEHAFFRGVFGALGHFVQLFLAHHVDGRLHQIAHHGLHVASHVTDLGVLGSFHLDERTTSQTREAPGDFRFSYSRGANHQNILGENVFRHFGRELLPAHTVAQRDGHRALCRSLSDDVLVQLYDNFARSELIERRLHRGFWFVLLTGKIDHHDLRSTFRVAPVSCRDFFWAAHLHQRNCRRDAGATTLRGICASAHVAAATPAHKVPERYYNSSNVKFAFVKIQISLAIRMASCAMSFADSLVCLESALAAASAKGPPEPMAQIPSSGSITSPFPETRNVDLPSATIRSASRCRSARSLRHSLASSTADFAKFP